LPWNRRLPLARHPSTRFAFGRPGRPAQPFGCVGVDIRDVIQFLETAMKIRTQSRSALYRAAFTLVEVMIAVMIVGLLTMIAVPNVKKFMETGKYNAILANLKAIELAKTTWQNENRKPDTAEPTQDELAPYFQGSKFPNSVMGETYNIGNCSDSARPTATTPSKIRNIEAGGLITLADQ
jgi:prepilin-type N-terminal cleavage/methylation domain-containing protein